MWTLTSCRQAVLKQQPASEQAAGSSHAWIADLHTAQCDQSNRISLFGGVDTSIVHDGVAQDLHEFKRWVHLF